MKKDVSIPAVAHLLQHYHNEYVFHALELTPVDLVTSFLVTLITGSWHCTGLQLVNMLQLTHSSSFYSPRLVVVISGFTTIPPCILEQQGGMVEDWSRKKR